MIVSKGLYEEIECMVRKFIWGSSNGIAKIALVCWDSMCQPKSHGVYEGILENNQVVSCYVPLVNLIKAMP